MKKRIKYIFILLTFLLFMGKVNALSVSKNDLTIEKGMSDSIELYVNTEVEITKVEFTMVYSTYDIPAAYVAASEFTDSNPYAITHVVTFPEAKSGKVLIGRIDVSVKSYPNDTSGSISIHTAKATATDGSVINLNSQEINVTVGTPKKKEPKVIDKNMLDKIESKIVTIELQKDVFEYNVEVDSKVEELDLKPVAKDSATKIDITTQKISEIKDNKIIVTTKQDDTEQKYVINIKIKKEENESNIVVDGSVPKVDTSYKTKWIILSIVLLVGLVVSLLSIKKK